MKKVLVASVGGSPEPIVNAIAEGQPDFVYFLCSAEGQRSDTLVEETIVPATGLSSERHWVERVSNVNVLRDVLEACSRIEEDLDRRFAGEELSVVANYTGGTRTMAAGLGALAVKRGWGTEWTAWKAPPTCGRILRVKLHAVTVFRDLDITFSPGLNVFIGENGTGKTHVLKCLYAPLRALDARALQDGDASDSLPDVLGGNVQSWHAPEDTSVVRVECEEAEIERIADEGKPMWARTPMGRAIRAEALFIPSREVLSMFPRFTAQYRERKVSFDKTFYDICTSLDQLELRDVSPALVPVLERLERRIGGSVQRTHAPLANSFEIMTSRGPLQAPMAAEGHRKLATLAYLIKCGALNEQTILFWDEPEANLNPKLEREVASILRHLSRAGVQTFVATHSYLLAREISMEAEYHPHEVDTRFFGFSKAETDGAVEVTSGAYMRHIKGNPIIQAYSEHYDHENTLFAGEPEELEEKEAP